MGASRLAASLLVLAAACVRGAGNEGRAAAARDAGAADAPPPPPLSVIVTLESPGQSAAEIERAVTAVVEDALSGIDGVVALTSEARPGAASFRVSIRSAASDLPSVRHALLKVARQLPENALEPTILRAPSAEPPIRFTIASDTLDGLTLRGLQIDVLSGLQTVPGVAQSSVCGGAEREVAVRVDPRRLAALGLTLREVAAALPGKAGEVAALGGLVVATRSGAPVRLSDVATIADGGRTGSVAFGANGRLLLGEVRIQEGASRAAIAARLGELRARLPAGVTLELLPEPAVELSLELPPGKTPDAAAAVARKAAFAFPGAVACWRRAGGDRVDLVVPADRSPEEMVRALATPEMQVRVPSAELELSVAGTSLELASAAEQVAAAIGGAPGIAAAGVDRGGGPRPLQKIDADRAAAAAVLVADAALVLEAAGDGVPVAGSSLPLRLRFPDRTDLGELLVPAAAGKGVPLGALVRSVSEPTLIRRANRMRAVTVWYRPAAPLSPASRVELRRRIDAVPLPAGVQLIGGP